MQPRGPWLPLPASPCPICTMGSLLGLHTAGHCSRDRLGRALGKQPPALCCPPLRGMGRWVLPRCLRIPSDATLCLLLLLRSLVITQEREFGKQKIQDGQKDPQSAVPPPSTLGPPMHSNMETTLQPFLLAEALPGVPTGNPNTIQRARDPCCVSRPWLGSGTQLSHRRGCQRAARMANHCPVCLP